MPKRKKYSSTESDVNIHNGKTWTVIDWLTTIWKSDHSDKIKTEMLPSCSRISNTVWLHHKDSNKMLEEKARWELHKNAARYFEESLETARYKRAAVQPLTSHHTNYPSKTNKILLKKQERTHK